MKNIKTMVGTHLWLVPSELYSDDFRNAVSKLNKGPLGKDLGWTRAEENAFLVVYGSPEVWKPL